jgi:hypothetical protein
MVYVDRKMRTFFRFYVLDRWVSIYFDLVLDIALEILRAFGFSQTRLGMP